MILLATQNIGKIKEFSALLPQCHFVLASEQGVQLPEETGTSFIENALLKAKSAATQVNHLSVLAEDSGLVVPALQGEPGIYSARYAAQKGTEQDNLTALLAAMKGLTGAARQAYYYCAFVWMRHAADPMPWIALTQWAGEIAETPMGDGGFGYDPIFMVPTHGCTSAMLPEGVKQQLSHRAQACEQFKQFFLANVNTP